MGKDVVFICRKCEHRLFITKPTLKMLGKLPEMDCPTCGEEGYENWILSHVGSWEKEKDNYNW